MSKLTSVGSKVFNCFEAYTYEQFYAHFNSYNQQLVKIVTQLIGKSNFIVELGSGSGLFAREVSNIVNPSLFLGLDPNEDMVKAAKSKTYHSKSSFIQAKANELPDYLNDEGLPDLIIAKSAFHHFEKDFPISEIMKYLAPNGHFVVIERTARSAKSYPLFDEGRDHWASFFSEQEKTRLRNNIYPDISSLFGQWVEADSNAYYEAISSNQLSFLWPYSPELIKKWAEQANQSSKGKIRVYEEFSISIFNKIS